MKLEEMIIEILASHDGIKTKDKCRVIRERYNENVDMSVIREILYNNLKDRVYQDNRYRWFLVRTDNSNQLNHISENDKSNTLISRLMSYYLECIAQDYDDGISEFAKSRYDLPAYAQINVLPQYANDANVFYRENNLNRVLNIIRASHGRTVVYITVKVKVLRAS